MGSEVSESFEVRMGLRQGCVILPWRFNMYMDGMARELYNRANRMGVSMDIDGV